MECPNCGYENPGELAYCENCDTQLAQDDFDGGDQQQCAACTSFNPAGAEMCEVCGTPIAPVVASLLPTVAEATKAKTLKQLVDLHRKMFETHGLPPQGPPAPVAPSPSAAALASPAPARRSFVSRLWKKSLSPAAAAAAVPAVVVPAAAPMSITPSVTPSAAASEREVENYCVFARRALDRAPMCRDQIPDFKQLTYGESKALMESFPEVKAMKDRTGKVPVIDLLLSTLAQGLPVFNKQPKINQDIIYSLQYIFYRIKSEKQPQVKKSTMMEIASAYQACQAVQQQTIIAMFSRLTNIELNFENQVLKTIGAYKMRKLDLLVAQLNPQLDHLTGPHVRSNYIMALEHRGIQLEGSEGAFLDKDARQLSPAEADRVTTEYLNLLSAEEFAQEFMEDINCQTAAGPKNIDCDKFYKFAMAQIRDSSAADGNAQHQGGFDPQLIFYDEDHPDWYPAPQPEADRNMRPYLRKQVARLVLKHAGLVDFL